MSDLMAHVGVLTRPDGTEIKGSFIIVSDLKGYRDKKIESLRSELASKDRRIEELEAEVQEGYDRINTPCGKVVDDLFKFVMPEESADWEYPAQAFRCIKGRIEELEAALDHCVGADIQGHIITREQINKAWALANDPAAPPEARAFVRAILEKFDIVACEACGGSGSYVAEDPECGIHEFVCPDCNGNGWVIK